MAKTRRQHKKRTSKTKRTQRAQGGHDDEIDRGLVAQIVEYNQQAPCSDLSDALESKIPPTEIPKRKNTIYEDICNRVKELGQKKTDDDRPAIVGEKMVLRSIMNELRDLVFEEPVEEDYDECISEDDMSVFKDIMMSLNIRKLCHIKNTIEEPDFFNNNVLGR